MLFLLCEARGILASYYKASRSFARRIVKPSHSVPYYRLMIYGWQPSVSHFDFAGILNANAMYSFTVGLPQLLFSILFMVSDRSTGREAAPCESPESKDLCSLIEDFNLPHVQTWIVIGSVVINIMSIMISVSNICIDFPAQIFDMVEKEEEQLFHQLQAEAACREWEGKLQTEVEESVKQMLKVSTTFKANQTPGMEAPRLIIDDVIQLEKKAMKRRVAILEFFVTKQERALAKARKERLERKREEAGISKA